eukprot:sb/3467525/
MSFSNPNPAMPFCKAKMHPDGCLRHPPGQGKNLTIEQILLFYAHETNGHVLPTYPGQKGAIGALDCVSLIQRVVQGAGRHLRPKENWTLMRQPDTFFRLTQAKWTGSELDKFVVGSKISFLSILRFCRSKSTHPSLRYVCYFGRMPTGSIFIKQDRNNPCVLLTHSLDYQYGALHCPVSLHGHEFSQHNKCISVMGGSILSGKNAKCSRSESLIQSVPDLRPKHFPPRMLLNRGPTVPSRNLSNSDSVHSHFNSNGSKILFNCRLRLFMAKGKPGQNEPLGQFEPCAARLSPS